MMLTSEKVNKVCLRQNPSTSISKDSKIIKFVPII